MSDELIEAMVRTLFRATFSPDEDEALIEIKWNEWAGDQPRYYRAARALLPVIRAHLEPNERMAEAGAIEAQKPAGWHSVYRNIWRAMLAASPIGDVG